jgi:hypothetical protein
MASPMPPSTADATEDVLSVEGLSITFPGLPDGFRLVDDVSFRVGAFWHGHRPASPQGACCSRAAI